ncbi:hypothetical protein EJ08DRAFT_706569 [Tothia fuscella]|uniref:Uncharacterized protein n=1 Tax=Tothia fuscella TaxID=1048955 RepID=A0A9P4TS65_9PEZI|nr:hypothetical protein EJ08DRAFT_706569 [Tothia fuscella]
MSRWRKESIAQYKQKLTASLSITERRRFEVYPERINRPPHSRLSEAARNEEVTDEGAVAAAATQKEADDKEDEKERVDLDWLTLLMDLDWGWEDIFARGLCLSWVNPCDALGANRNIRVENNDDLEATWKELIKVQSKRKPTATTLRLYVVPQGETKRRNNPSRSVRVRERGKHLIRVLGYDGRSRGA